MDNINIYIYILEYMYVNVEIHTYANIYIHKYMALFKKYSKHV